MHKRVYTVPGVLCKTGEHVPGRVLKIRVYTHPGVH